VEFYVVLLDNFRDGEWGFLWNLAVKGAGAHALDIRL
jgi:hypothetical protein